jgi:hypothetical protein
MQDIRRLADYPYVLVRLRCEVCNRAGAHHLARLAVKFGAEILLDDLIMTRGQDYGAGWTDLTTRLRLSSDCPWRDEARGACGARFCDLPPGRPPALPRPKMRVIAGGRR